MSYLNYETQQSTPFNDIEVFDVVVNLNDINSSQLISDYVFGKLNTHCLASDGSMMSELTDAGHKLMSLVIDMCDQIRDNQTMYGDGVQIKTLYEVYDDCGDTMYVIITR